MTQFTGPQEFLNQKFLQDVTQGAHNIARTVPKLPDNEEQRRRNEEMAMRGVLLKQSAEESMRQRRQELIDAGIMKNTEENPIPQTVLNQRRAPRLTIGQINNMTRDEMRARIQQSGDLMGDQRGAFYKFLDVIDLPRNSIFNIAFTDKGGAEDFAAGAGVMAAGGAIYGGLKGALAGAKIGAAGGPLGAAVGAGIGTFVGAVARGAVASAAKAVGVYALPLGAASIIGHSALSEEDRKEIRISSEEEMRAAFGMRRVYSSEVLKQLGVENKTSRAILGLAGDILLDPLSYLTGSGTVAMWSARSGKAGVIASRAARIPVETRGVKYLKDAASELLEKGTVIRNEAGNVVRIELPAKSQYKQLEDFLNKTILVDNGVAGSVAQDISPGLNHLGRLDEALEAVGNATNMTRKEKKLARDRIVNQARDRLITYRSLGEIANKGDDVVAAVESSREFFYRFQAKAGYQIHVPFADWFAPLLWKRIGYRNAGTNIPFLPIGRTARRRKAMKQLSDPESIFGAAEATKRAAIMAENAAEIGRFESVMAKATITGRTAEAAAEETARVLDTLPPALRDKAEVIESSKGYRNEIVIPVTELDHSTYMYIKGQKGWKIDAPEVSAEFVFDSQRLEGALLSRQRLGEVDVTADSVRMFEEEAYYRQMADAYEESLESWRAADREFKSELPPQGEGLPGFTEEQLERMNVLKGKIDEAEADLRYATRRRDLSATEIEDMLTPRTSLVLDALDEVRGDFFGQGVGIYEGPGYLSRLFSGHNARVHELSNRLAVIHREERLIHKHFDRRKKAIAHAGGEDVRELDTLNSRLEDIARERDEILGELPTPSPVAVSIAREAAEAFKLDDAESQALAQVLDAAAEQWFQRTGGKAGSKEDFLRDQFQVMRGGKAPDGREVLYQGGRMTPEHAEIHMVHTLSSDGRDAGWKASAEQVMSHAGVTNATMRTGTTVNQAGDTVPANVISINQSMSEEDIYYSALVNGFLGNHNDVSAFIPGKGGAQVLTIKNVDASSLNLGRKLESTTLEDGTLMVFGDNRKELQALRKQLKGLKDAEITSEQTGQIRRFSPSEEAIEEARRAGGKEAAEKVSKRHLLREIERIHDFPQSESFRPFRPNGADPIGEQAAALRREAVSDLQLTGQLPSEVIMEYGSINAAQTLRAMGPMKAEEWLDWFRLKGNKKKSSLVDQSTPWPFKRTRPEIDKNTGKVIARAGDPLRIPEDELVNSGLLDFLESNKGKSLTSDEIENFLLSNQMDMQFVDLTDPVQLERMFNPETISAQINSIESAIRDEVSKVRAIMATIAEEPIVKDIGDMEEIVKRMVRMPGATGQYGWRAVSHILTPRQQVELSRSLKNIEIYNDAADFYRGGSASELAEDAYESALEYSRYTEGGALGKHMFLTMSPQMIQKNPIAFAMNIRGGQGEHFANIPGAIAWVRVTDRGADLDISPSAKRYLQIEEVQSDLFQQREAKRVFNNQLRAIAEEQDEQLKQALNNKLENINQDFVDVIAKSGVLPEEVVSVITQGVWRDKKFEQALEKYYEWRSAKIDGLSRVYGKTRFEQELEIELADKFVNARLKTSTPAMPFANTSDVRLPSGRPIDQWTKLAVRRVLMHATKEGYDGVITPDKFVAEELTGGRIQALLKTDVLNPFLRAAQKENMHLLPISTKRGDVKYMGLEKVDEDYLKSVDQPIDPGTSRVIEGHPDEIRGPIILVADEKGNVYKVTPNTRDLGQASDFIGGKPNIVRLVDLQFGLGDNFNKGLSVSTDTPNPVITGLKSNMMMPTRGTLNPGLAAHVEKIDEVVPEILTETAGRADGLPLFEKTDVPYKQSDGNVGYIVNRPREAYQFTKNRSRRSTLDNRMGRKGSVLFQMGDGDMARASVEFTEDGKSLIRALNEPDVGSFIHEAGHIFRRYGLSDEAQDALEARYGIFDEWDEASEEDFAQAFMRYFETGKAPTPQLQEAFDVIGGAMRKIYEKSYDGPINGSLRNALDELFGATKESKEAAKRVRSLKSQKNQATKKRNAVRARIAKHNELVKDTDDKMEMALAARRDASAPIQEELDVLKSRMVHKGSEVAEKYNRLFRDLTGAGRRGRYAGQLVSSFRHAHENLPEFQRRLFIDDFDKNVGYIKDRLGMTNEDASLILHAKILEKDEEARRVFGWHPSEKILDPNSEGGLEAALNRYGGREKVWNDPQINRLAEKIQKSQSKMLLREVEDGALAIADPRFAYVGLRLTDDAQRAAWAQSAKNRELRDRAASGRKVSGEGPASQHRATNRYFYQTNNPNPFWTDGDGRGWDFVWAGEIGSKPLPEEFEIWRREYLRENIDEMLPGDIYEYNVKIKEAGGSSDQYIPTPGWTGDAIGNPNGARWMPQPYATSPYELNRPEMAHRFTDMLGRDYKGQVWETDLGIVLGKRMREHHRTAAVADFVKNIMPEMKALSVDEVNDAVSNPRQGMQVVRGGSDLIINGTPYRRLTNEVANNRMLDRLLGNSSKNFYYPEDVASALEDYITKITDDQNLTTIGRVFDYVQSMWKGSVLMNPAWTTVNVLGGIIHSVVVGGMNLADFARHFATAKRMAHQFHFGNRKGAFVPTGPGLIFDDTKKYIVGGEEMTETELAEHLVRINALDGSQVAREVMSLHRTAFGNPDAYTKKTIMDQVRNIATLGPLGAWWFRLNASIDDTFRTAVYLARREKGDMLEDAALTMKKSHFDYGDFTKYEEKFGRRLIPFYAWQRNNIALQYKLLFEKPAYANFWTKLKHAMEVEGLDEEDRVPVFMLPRWLRNQVMIQTSSDDGTAKGLVLSSLVPVQDLIMTGQGVFGVEGFKDMAHYFLGSSSPILKSLFELGTGQQVFDGRKIGDPDLGELSITEYVANQIGYYNSWKGLERAFTRDGTEGLWWRLAVRGRWQPLDIDKLQAQISVDKSEEIKLLRRQINRAMNEGDEQRAEDIGMRIIDQYRVLWHSGIRHRVPKELWPEFNREGGMLRREGRPIPGRNVPIQPQTQ